jgi:hypothetical protein
VARILRELASDIQFSDLVWTCPDGPKVLLDINGNKVGQATVVETETT